MRLAIIGHRRFRFELPHSAKTISKIVCPIITDELKNLKPSVVYSGGTLGFDYFAVTVAHSLSIPYVFVLPYRGFWMRWPKPTREPFVNLSVGASRLIFLSRGRPGYDKMRRRNFWLVDNTDYVLANWDGSKSLTGETVNYAWSRRKEVKNVWPKIVKRAEECLL